jgi:small-conductance mechanosensitive channel
MKEIRGYGGGSMSPTANTDIKRRIFRTMAFATAFAVVTSLTFAQWRVTSGLLLGGVLALLNYHWLSSSTAAAFSVMLHGTRPRLSLVQYVLRYLVITLVVLVAYKVNVVSLPATIVGLCSFVPALFGEALREFYFAIIQREEIN